MLARRHRYALLLTVVLAGGLLRFGAVGYGLPRHDLGQDEQITQRRVLYGVLKEKPPWPAFHWPNLNIHLSRAGLAATRWLEARAGSERHDILLVGRALTAGLCTLTLLALYLVGSRLFDPQVGLAAAAFLAVIPLHVFRSRLWVPDAPMTLFYTLALLAAVGILRRPSVVRFVAAGIAVGLATATKYNGVGACLPVVVAALVARPAAGARPGPGARLARLALAGAVSVAVFFAANPLALLHFQELLEGMGFVGTLYTDEPSAGLLGWHILRYVGGAFFAAGYEGVGPVISALALGGWLFLMLRPSRAGLLAWLPGLLYLLTYSSVLRNAYERMFLPLTPHIALLAGLALVGGARELEALARRRWPRVRVAAATAVAVLAIAAVPAASHTFAARHGETRVEAAAWIDANLPAGARLFIEWDMIAPAAERFGFDHMAKLLWRDGRTPESVAGRHDFVVSTSTTSDWVLRQRRRPVFDRRADHYAELFGGPRFELVARFEPDLMTYGPEVRVYRTLPPRGPRLGPGRASAELRQPWANTKRLREQRKTGLYTLLSAGELVAGKARVQPGGRYALELLAEAAEPAVLELALGDEVRRLAVDGRHRLAVEDRLPAGQLWWRVAAAPGFPRGGEVTISHLRLVRRSAEDGKAPVEPGPPAEAGGAD